jgi:nucleoside-diphosphate-sugar epimerase
MRLYALQLSLHGSALFHCAVAFSSVQWSGRQVVTHPQDSTTNLYASALIIQNKGGGHGELGYQLAKTLQTNEKISSITILQDDACKDLQEPFKSYATDLPQVSVIKAPLSDDSLTASTLQELLGGESVRFDYVWDNASKSADGAGKASVDCVAAWGKDAVQLYTYVSSAGVYKPGPDAVFPMPESTTPVKESAGQVAFERYAAEQGLPLVSFRPQYIYGEKANKHDYIDYFFDRIVRGLPVPIPGDGTQLVSLSNSQDVAAILASPLAAPAAAIEQRIFNCGTDRLYTYDQVAALCAKVAGMELTIEHYDADLFGKTSFPFRDTNFYVDPSRVKSVLGWTGAVGSLESDLEWYYADYKARGGPDKKMSLVKDWEICVGCRTAPPEYVRSIYDKYDPLIIDTSGVQ